MTISIPASVRLAAAPAARIGGAGGYRLEGDQVVLNADLEWLQPEAVPATDWALQLWAWPNDAASAVEAIKIAEVPLTPAATDAAVDRVESAATALPPAGPRAYTVVLALSAGHGGVCDVVHDLLVFPRAEQFVQPHFDGPVGYAFDGDHVRLQATQVLNPRTADNLSGDLSLQLWALDAPYSGGAFAGYRVAASGLGRLAGQGAWRDVQASAGAEPLPVGRWSLSLMLREWTGAAGWVTRDYANFPLTHDVAPPTSQVDAPASASNQLSDQAAAAMPAPHEPIVSATTVDAAPAQAMKAAVVKAEKPAMAAKPAKVEKAKAAPKTEKARAKAIPAYVGNGLVSINRATEAELRAVKGMAQAVAKAIVAARPHRSVEALVEVKGVGEKLLAKLRPFLGL